MQKTFYIPGGEEDLVDKVKEVSDKDSFSSAVLEALQEYVKRRDKKTELERRLEELVDEYASYQRVLDNMEAEVELLVTKIQEENGKLPVPKNNLLEDGGGRHLLDQLEKKVERGGTKPLPLTEDEKVNVDNG